MDIKKSHSSLLARIKLLGKRAGNGMIPLDPWIQHVKAKKGQDTETLQAKFDTIICKADFKRLDAATSQSL